jgi:hypothetical protein
MMMTKMRRVCFMTETKNTPEKLPVQTQRLVNGINLMFAGIGEILSAMEPDMAKSLQALAAKTRDDLSGFEELPTEDTATEETAAEPEKKPKAKPKKAADKPTELTVDDLIKVVTQKIKQDRSNKEKVLGLLKSYGAAKVSDVPAEQYEAFLTDLSQL